MNTPVSSSRQMTLDVEPGLTERHTSLLGCIREVAYTQRQPLKELSKMMPQLAALLKQAGGT